MRQFSTASKLALGSCDTRLQRVFNAVILTFDCTVVCGNRSKAAQDEAFRTGASKLQWPNSLHNRSPSLAVDVVPYYPGEGIPWGDRERFVYFSGYAKGFAAALGIKLRTGADWDMDNVLRDQSFHDLPHFEIDDT